MINIILGKPELQRIADRLRFTKHAKERLDEYMPEWTENKIKQMICNSPLAWQNTDGKLNILVNENEYLVITERKKVSLLVTFMRKGLRGYNAIDKFVMAYKGIKKENIKK